MGHQCICCRVAFESPEEHRTHYQSDWHCYNLKRKVAKLPPLTQPEFVERKKTADDEKAAQKNKKRNKTSKKQQKNHEDNDVDNEENEEKENISKWKSGDNPRLITHPLTLFHILTKYPPNLPSGLIVIQSDTQVNDKFTFLRLINFFIRLIRVVQAGS